MKVLLTILIGAIIVLAVRLYVIDFGVHVFNFGCMTAAQKLEQTDILEGERLKIFCDAYTNGIRKYY
jgi:hypothetical protein